MIIDKAFVDLFVKTTERGAYGASNFKGKNDKEAADKAAVDEMRKELNKINMKGRIVIGEGEMDEAPMLYINEKVGTNRVRYSCFFVIIAFLFSVNQLKNVIIFL